MLSRAMADATGVERNGSTAVPIKGRGAISLKGASGTAVEVRNLVKGTTAEDVKVRHLNKNWQHLRSWR
jgi:hypothetical protein